MPSKREALTVTVIMALFLLLTSIFIGLRSEHLLMAVLYLVLFFAGLPTRKLAVALLPFAIFGISYDWMRICGDRYRKRHIQICLRITNTCGIDNPLRSSLVIYNTFQYRLR